MKPIINDAVDEFPAEVPVEVAMEAPARIAKEVPVVEEVPVEVLREVPVEVSVGSPIEDSSNPENPGPTKPGLASKNAEMLGNDVKATTSLNEDIDMSAANTIVGLPSINLDASCEIKPESGADFAEIRSRAKRPSKLIVARNTMCAVSGLGFLTYGMNHVLRMPQTQRLWEHLQHSLLMKYHQHSVPLS